MSRVGLGGVRGRGAYCIAKLVVQTPLVDAIEAVEHEALGEALQSRDLTRREEPRQLTPTTSSGIAATASAVAAWCGCGCCCSSGWWRYDRDELRIERPVF